MTKRCMVPFILVLALALSLPCWAQEEGGGENISPQEETPTEEGSVEEGLGDEGGSVDGLPDDNSAPSDESLKTSESDIAPTTPLLNKGDATAAGKATWKDIVVLPRKEVLKRRRVEILPFYAATLNDNLIQHHAVGGEINYFLTDILSIGLTGMYYFKNALDQEFYTRYHFERVPSLNRYRYTFTFNFAYVPVYGKFALFNKKIFHYEAFATAGVGGTGTEIIPRNANYEKFSNPFRLTFPVGLGVRFFINRWLAFQTTFKDYLLIDKFEPEKRSQNDLEEAKKNGPSVLVNNVMFNVGISIFLPTTFSYTTFR